MSKIIYHIYNILYKVKKYFHTSTMQYKNKAALKLLVEIYQLQKSCDE